MQKNKKMGNQDEVRTLLLSLLIARKGATPIPVLERDYYDMENKRIPYRKFGCTSLVQFLQSMPEHFVVEEFNGGHYVSGIADKSKHVSSLVSRQKTSSNLRPRYSFRQAPTFHRRIQHTRFQPVRMTTEKLIELVQYIKSYPNGVSLENAVLYAQTLMPYVSISQHDLQAQLYEVMHQLRLDGNMIHAIQNDSQSNVAQQPSNQQPLMKKPSMQLWNKSELPRDSLSPPTQQTEYAAGEEDFELADFSDDAFVPVRNNTDNYQRRPKTSEMLATNLAQHVKSEQTDMFNYSKNPNDIEILENNYFMTNSNYTETRVTECLQDKSEIVSDRIKARLEKLLQKYPDGIWCADLPDIYLREYKVHLNYNKLGFTSVREFTSYLPKIFYMTQVNKTDDFKLYNADKRPVVPKVDPINETSHNHCYDEHRTAQAQYNNDSDDEPIPSDVSPTITKKFAPDGVMNYGDDIGKILVTDLKRTKKFLEIYVMEVFHPNFFWIHLRENRKRFNKMMDELHTFYVRNKDKYTIAKVALKKDLNCACVYADKWHRAIIKSVKPDFRVTVCFYDYGTVKTYAAENIYYLHSMFSILPAQAIPCSLYNIKPTVGDRWKKSANDQFVDKINETLLAATIITIDPPNNSMLVVLTDTSEDEDVCINDWLVKEKLAQVGKTDAVDMASLMKYVVNNLNQIPSYCFAEENLMPENCYKVTSTEEKHEVPSVSSGPMLSHYDNQYQQQPVKPPPGFQPLGEQCIPSNASTKSFQNSYSFANANPSNASNTKASVFSDAQATTNPFLTDEQFISSDVIEQLYMTIWNENKKLHIGMNEILCDMLKPNSSLSLQNQIQLNKILKIVKKILLEQKDDYSTVEKTPTVSNLANITTLNDVDSAQKASYNLNNETAANQEPIVNISSTSNPFGINVDDRLQNNTTFSAYDSDSFSFKNWNQSGELNPCMQIPPSTANPTPSMFINHIPPTSTFLPKANQDSENVPLTPVSSAVLTNTNVFNNFSEYLNNMNTQFAGMLKDTNPFKFSMTDVSGTQVPETQTERTVNNYDTSISPYLSTKNLHSNTLKTETANIHARNNGFTSVSNLGHVSESYTPRIVYESGPVMYNTQKKQTDVNVNTNVRQNTCSSNFDNVQNTQSLKLEQSDKKLASQVSQSAKDIASLHTQHTVINNNIRDNLQSDENYVTQLSTYFVQGLQSTNGELIYSHQNTKADNLQTVSSQSLNQFEIPEHWTNSKFQSSIPFLNHIENTPITLSHQDWNCDNDRKSVSRKNEVTNSSNIFKVNGYDKEGSMDIYANSWHNNEKGSVQNKNAAYSPFIFHKIDSVKGITFIFNFEQDGWILTNEFIETFTSYKLLSRLLTKINMWNIKITFKEILRSQYPIQFSQLDRYPLNVPRDSENHILSINLISFPTTLVLLHKLKIISRDEIDNAFKKNEFLDGSVLRTLWTLILSYRKLKQHIELYSNEFFMYKY